MYCRNCGKPIDPNSVYCPECGANQCDAQTTSTTTTTQQNQQQYQQQQYQQQYQPQQQYRPVVQDAPSAGFAVLSFFFPLVGLILYLVWMDQMPLRAKSCGKGALVAVIVEAVAIIGYLLIFFVFALIASSATTYSSALLLSLL